MNGVVFKAILLVVFTSVSASASNLTFKFVNPAFSGGPKAGEYMLDVARGLEKGRHGATGSRTPTYNIVVNDGSVTFQNGDGNFATTTIQEGNDNQSTSTQTAQ